jgi:hypothetical protein
MSSVTFHCRVVSQYNHHSAMMPLQDFENQNFQLCSEQHPLLSCSGAGPCHQIHLMLH